MQIGDTFIIYEYPHYFIYRILGDNRFGFLWMKGNKYIMARAFLSNITDLDDPCLIDIVVLNDNYHAAQAELALAGFTKIPTMAKLDELFETDENTEYVRIEDFFELKKNDIVEFFKRYGL